MDASTESLANPSAERPWRLFGVLGSLFVHGLVLFLLLQRIGQTEPLPLVLPIEVVPLADETTSPAPSPAAGAGQQAALQQRRPPAPRVQANPNPVSRVAPSKVPEPTNDRPAPPRDALQVKLEELAKLMQPDSDARIVNGLDVPGRGSNGNGRGLVQAYSVKDFIRAQVERRWNLDLGALAGRKLTVSIHVVLERDGSVAKAEIVGSGYGNDEVTRNIAISARNAVILSSPFALPEGSYEAVKDMVLDLNPMNTVR